MTLSINHSGITRPKSSKVSCDHCGLTTGAITTTPPDFHDPHDSRLAAMTAGWFQNGNVDTCPTCKKSGRDLDGDGRKLDG